MEYEKILQWAKSLQRGELSPEELARNLSQGVLDLGDTRLDLDRARRCGFPEVVYAEGKTVPTLRDIFNAQIAMKIDVLATRLSGEKAERLSPHFPTSKYNPIARTFRIPPEDSPEKEKHGKVVVVSAGTSDLPVAEEARETLDWTGADVDLIQDVGVAGPHRLQASLPRLRESHAIVVVAGMEGALPSVVGGYVSCPVIAVPTSVGYGASFGGIAALLGMLNSCASNVCVVNIDAGFKAGYVAGLIAKNATNQHRSEQDT